VAEGGGGSVQARTVSGAVALDLQASGDRDIRRSSVSGDLTVRLPEASDLEVELQSTSGQVVSAFEQLEHEQAPGRHPADRLAGRLAIVDRGRVVAQGSPNELKGELRGDAIQVELGDPEPDGRATADIPGFVADSYVRRRR
jgi:hypothetical protein